MERKWGRKGRSREDNQRCSELKKDIVFKWLQKGWYTVNLQLIDANAGQLSNNRFWALVKELMPGKRHKKEVKYYKEAAKESESKIIPQQPIRATQGHPVAVKSKGKLKWKKSRGLPATTTTKLWP